MITTEEGPPLLVRGHGSRASFSHSMYSASKPPRARLPG